MIRYLAIAGALTLATCTAVPATAQTIAGCGTTAIGKAERNNAAKLVAKAACFEKAGAGATAAEKVHRARLAEVAPATTPAPKPTPSLTWTRCAVEGERCSTTPARVRYIAVGKSIERAVTGSIDCTNDAFGGDPLFGTAKVCETTGTVVAAPPPVPAPLPPITTGPVRATQIGVNVGSFAYFAGDPVFANLVTGSEWPENVAADRLGNPVLKPGDRFRRMITVPAPAMAGHDVTVRCTWEGKGTVWAAGGKGVDTEKGPNVWEFVWNGAKGVTNNHVWLEVAATEATPADPLRNFDCREKGVARDAVFGPESLSYLRNFSVLRFLDWSGVNGNPVNVTWANRTLPGSIDQVASPLGVAIEHQIAVANAVGASPWFNVAWNADEDYVRRFAQMVHDGIPAQVLVYVELSNEVWNYSFSQTRQAQAEGFAAGLAPNDFKAVLMRYAQKSAWMLDIWADVFKDRPGQLVRVAATQGFNPWTAEVVLGEGKLAAHVDALAVAPYFGGGVFEQNPGVTDVPTLMAAVKKDAVAALAGGTQGSADVARKYGKRFIAYEAGQHLVNHADVGLVAALNRSPEMGDAYRAYIAGWKARYGDVLTLYSATGPISGWGAWGMREYAGQPASEAPKIAAALEAAGR